MAMKAQTPATRRKYSLDLPIEACRFSPGKHRISQLVPVPLQAPYTGGVQARFGRG